MRRIVVVLGVAVLMLALIAGPVAAQADVTREVYEGSFPTPDGSTATTLFECGDNQEWLSLSYEYKAFIDTVTKPNGGQTYMFHTLVHGQAVGVESGRTFLFHSAGNETYQVEQIPIISEDGEEVLEPGEMRHSKLNITQFLVSPGSEDNFFIQWTVYLDENGEPVFEKPQIGCRG
jgi:hypothetical protein